MVARPDAVRGASARLSELAVGIGPFVVGPAIERRIGASAFSAMELDADWRDAHWCLAHGLYTRLCDNVQALDVDGDGIPFRTYPGTHPTKGSFFTRGTSRDRYARYTEEGAAYVDNMQRLLRKFETAKDLVPGPVITRAAQPTRAAVVWFGSPHAPHRGRARPRGWSHGTSWA